MFVVRRFSFTSKYTFYCHIIERCTYTRLSISYSKHMGGLGGEAPQKNFANLEAIFQENGQFFMISNVSKFDPPLFRRKIWTRGGGQILSIGLIFYESWFESTSWTFPAHISRCFAYYWIHNQNNHAKYYDPHELWTRIIYSQNFLLFCHFLDDSEETDSEGLKGMGA